MTNIKKEYLYLKEELEAAMSRVHSSGQYILGPELEAFEKNFAMFNNARFAVGVGSGHDALQLALMALGISYGDEVITVAHTFASTAMAIVAVGARPVFVDVGDDYLMDAKLIESKITSRTKAILPVHLYGAMCDMQSINAIARKHKLKVIEDAAQAHGASTTYGNAGVCSDIGCFSFYPTKNLGAYGDGGAIVTNSEEVYKKIKSLRNYGKGELGYEEVGMNSRLDELQAACLSVKLNHLRQFNHQRRITAATYDAHLGYLEEAGMIKLPPKATPESRPVYHQYVIRVPNAPNLQEYLTDHGIQTQVHYARPLHLEPVFAQYSDVSLPVTESLQGHILSLPIESIGNADIFKVIQLIVQYHEPVNID